MMTSAETAYLTMFGEHLRKIRKRQKMSITELATLCNIDKSKLSKFEHGKINLTMLTLNELAKGLGIPVHMLLDF